MPVLAALSTLPSHAGMTQGTLAGMIISDQILGRQNPFTDVSLPMLPHPTFICGDAIFDAIGYMLSRSYSSVCVAPKIAFICISAAHLLECTERPSCSYRCTAPAGLRQRWGTCQENCGRSVRQ